MAQDNVHLVGYCLRVGAFLTEGPRSGGMSLSKALPTCAAKQQWLQIYGKNQLAQVWWDFVKKTRTIKPIR
jgi:hypothetical protein